MDTNLIIAIIGGIGGWLWGAYQYYNNIKLQRKNKLAEWRYNAYLNYMKKYDEINESMRKNPNMIYGITNDFLVKIFSGDDTDTALLQFNEKLLTFVKDGLEPIRILKQELNVLLLVASGELSLKIKELITLSEDFINEYQNCLSKISVKDTYSFKKLETMGHDKRWQNFQILNDAIVSLMRKEINIEK